MKANTIPAVILIVLGALLLANNLIPEFRLTTVILKWWPLLLIVLGANMLWRGNGPR